MLHKLKTSLWTAIPTLAVIILLALKLLRIGVFANLSWWWVFAPIWVPVVVIFVLVGIGNILYRVMK